MSDKRESPHLRAKPLVWVEDHGVAALGPYRLFRAKTPFGQTAYGTDAEGNCYWQSLSAGVHMSRDEDTAKRAAEASWEKAAIAEASKLLDLSYTHPAPQPSGPVQALEALEHARELMWEYGFSENDLQPIRDAISALTAGEPAQVPSGWVAVPQSALNWLFGTGPDADGNWFGDTARETEGRYWWRSHFRMLISPAAPTAGGDADV